MYIRRAEFIGQALMILSHILCECENEITIEKLAEKGVEGCNTKEVMLASFGCLSLNGGLASSVEMRSLATEIRKFGWRVIGICFTVLVSIIISLVLL